MKHNLALRPDQRLLIVSKYNDSLTLTFRRPPPITVGRDSSVGIATRYVLDGPGIESRWWTRLSAPVQTGPGAYLASYSTGTESLSPGVKRPGLGVDHPPSSSAEVKEKVELYLYSPFWTSWPVIGWALPLPLPYINAWTSSLCWENSQ